MISELGSLDGTEGQGTYVDYHSLGHQLQQRQTSVQQVESHYQSNNTGAITSSVSVQQMHTELPALDAIGRPARIA